MTFVSCPSEKEIRELIESGQWPLASPPDLRTHAATCRSCADLVLVASAFQRARSTTLAAAKPVSAGAIWWRAQLRSRQQAFERIQRPIVGAQVFGLVAVLLPIIGFIAWQAQHGLAWLSWFSKTSQSAQIQAGGLAGSTAQGSPTGLILMIVAAATIALIAGVALYFDEERK